MLARYSKKASVREDKVYVNVTYGYMSLYGTGLVVSSGDLVRQAFYAYF